MSILLVVAGEAFRQRALAFPDVPAGYRDAIYLLVAMAFLPFSVVGALILTRRPRNRVAWILCAAGLTGAVSYFTHGSSALGYFASPGSLPFAALGLWIDQWVFIPSLFLASTLLILLFPDGRLPSHRWKSFLWLAVASTVFFCAAWAFAAGPMQRAQLDNPFAAPPPLGNLLAAFVPAGWYAMLLMAVGAVVSILARYRHTGPDERAQIRWVAYAAGVMAATFVASVVLYPFITARTDDMGRTLQAASNILVVGGIATIPVAAGVAVTRYHLYDIDELINRTFVFGSLTAILAGLYTASIKLFQALFVAVTGEESDAAVVITTLVLATSFTPVKRRLEALVERRFKEAPAVDLAAAGAASTTSEVVDSVRSELREQAKRLERLERLLSRESTTEHAKSPADSSGVGD